ncbi:MAG TPA: endonuclease/exonuclease/phosphatase family protein [Candidatus Flavonifractor intestinipullorum]|uniref:Endonuclease/exonuclease/phosphatase family protein n=1 Tax=Candidatus Flavonifractor intestinipullorum TaxID=2838587 RepID=A0A9D2S4E6_9FIRM|nr:endonuclease/exonuclease/phosphatase family protein [Candidatus Flavonifractor intestinipullorum]
MKLLTLNCHSLVEPGYESKLAAFAGEMLRRQPDIIALQEVNQTRSAPPAPPEGREGYVPCETAVPLRRDNHALRLAALLRDGGWPMEWTWTPAKIGYGIYEEGLALLSRAPIRAARAWYTTRDHAMDNWRVRKALSIHTAADGVDAQFLCVHMGWWADEPDPFPAQWRQVEAGVDPALPCFILGDLNSPAGERGTGYDYVTRRGWRDAYRLAQTRSGEATVPGAIDGWRERPEQGAMRIDYILCSRPTAVERCQVLLDGINGPVVSDHFGVMATGRLEEHPCEQAES